MEKENRKFIEGHLKRFIKSNQDESFASDLLDQGVEKAEVFRVIANGKGSGKSHASGKYKEGELKDS